MIMKKWFLSPQGKWKSIWIVGITWQNMYNASEIRVQRRWALAVEKLLK
jgi:hypothetical protein